MGYGSRDVPQKALVIPDFAELTSVELFMCRAYRRKEKHLAGSCSTWRTFAQASGPQNLTPAAAQVRQPKQIAAQIGVGLFGDEIRRVLDFLRCTAGFLHRIVYHADRRHITRLM